MKVRKLVNFKYVARKLDPDAQADKWQRNNHAFINLVGNVSAMWIAGKHNYVYEKRVHVFLRIKNLDSLLVNMLVIVRYRVSK